MEEELKKQLEQTFAQGKDTAIQCLDSTGLPLSTIGKCSVEASKLLSAIYRHAQLVTDAEGEKPPVVVLERERRGMLSVEAFSVLRGTFISTLTSAKTTVPSASSRSNLS
ncbi:unnamed protein product [Hymenolepis diminuta]|uniref:Late endosomal/lysosomal adaptor and MAPK and MTOR activator 5 n=1 Tax=Hymenolepis diminuta TaxID=6216 RepID=A0A0R3SG45_HYMDI|nr:unnamed protein product [Hymenolepis diminuta]